MRKISKELLLIVICLIIIMLVCADVIPDFSQNPSVSLIQVLQWILKFISPNKNNLFISQLGLSQDNREVGFIDIVTKILPLHPSTNSESYLRMMIRWSPTGTTQQKYEISCRPLK